MDFDDGLSKVIHGDCRHIDLPDNSVHSVVLDPFVGTGTTLIAAKRLGHKGIGIDLSEGYCRMTIKRLQSEPMPSRRMI